MRSITTLDLQYAHRFFGFKGEAQYLHGHTGVLTIEVEDSIEPGVNMVFPCNEIQKTAWEVLKNFDHALILREDDPLLPAILKVYEEQGIRDGAPTNKMKGPAFKTDYDIVSGCNILNPWNLLNRHIRLHCVYRPVPCQDRYPARQPAHQTVICGRF